LLWQRGESSREICKSPEEIPISFREIHKSKRERPIFLPEIGISSGDLDNSQLESSKGHVREESGLSRIQAVLLALAPEGAETTREALSSS